jgi:glucokinase
VSTPHTGGPDTILSFFREHLGHVAQQRQPAAVGIGASGPIDPAGSIRNPDTLPAFTGVPLADLVATLVPGPVTLENDAVCAALAEHHVGAARRSRRSLHVTLGTGIGVCLLDGGTPFRLGDGTHPEGGHIAVAIPTVACYCGRPACWEQAASRQNLQRTAADLLGRSPSDSTAIADLAARDDSVARTAFRDYGARIAEGLATLLALYGPDLVVLGGSAASYLPLYRAAIVDRLAPLGGWLPSYDLTGTQLDDYGGAIGGAGLAIDALRLSPARPAGALPAASARTHRRARGTSP